MAADQSVNRGENLDTPGNSLLLLCEEFKLFPLPNPGQIACWCRQAKQRRQTALNRVINDTESVSGETA